jgi:hypothetical protein
MNRHVLLIAFCCLISTVPVYSQESSAEAFNTSYPVSLFTEANASQSRLNNGREYVLPASYILGHPFFETKVWTPGKLVYDGVAFNNVDMLYDISKDELIILNFALPNKLSLVKNKVKEFEVRGHKFIYLEPDTQRPTDQAGFYDQLYHQKVSVLARRRKIVEVSRNTALDANFVEDDQYYLVKENVLYPVKSRGSVLKVLKDKKTDLQQYLRKNDIIFRLDPENAIIRMAAYYDQLSN